VVRHRRRTVTTNHAIANVPQSGGDGIRATLKTGERTRAGLAIPSALFRWWSQTTDAGRCYAALRRSWAVNRIVHT
jgi:hypothetical protein